HGGRDQSARGASPEGARESVAERQPDAGQARAFHRAPRRGPVRTAARPRGAGGRLNQAGQGGEERAQDRRQARRSPASGRLAQGRLNERTSGPTNRIAEEAPYSGRPRSVPAVRAPAVRGSAKDE